jgi:hypothetical protein
MENYVQFISTLFASRTQVHIYHLQTPSYAAHIALQGYYDGIVALADGLVESFQGRYGILRGYTSPASFKEDDQLVKYFDALSKYVENTRTTLPQDSYIQNEIDNVVALIEGTRYKLKYLS